MAVLKVSWCGSRRKKEPAEEHQRRHDAGEGAEHQPPPAEPLDGRHAEQGAGEVGEGHERRQPDRHRRVGEA